MTEATPDRPSDTEAAHAPSAGAAKGDARVDQNFVSHIEGGERRERTGEPVRGRFGATTAGAAADRLKDDAGLESGDDPAAGQDPRR